MILKAPLVLPTKHTTTTTRKTKVVMIFRKMFKREEDKKQIEHRTTTTGISRQCNWRILSFLIKVQVSEGIALDYQAKHKAVTSA